NVSCNGGTNGVASVSPSGGTPGYTYSWSPSGGT
ncbi:SprB repeat-containing protein, partial [Flavobacterium terrigena]